MSHFLNPKISQLLSKFAASKGLAIPAHRFGMATESDSGSKFDDLDQANLILELWTTFIPFGNASIVGFPNDRESLPLLWIDESDDTKTCILKSQLSNGQFTIEDLDGASSFLDASVAKKGIFISLLIQNVKNFEESKSGKSAKEWFQYAIKKRSWLFFEAVIATTVVSILALAASLFTMQVYDRVVPTQSYSTLIVLAIGTLLAVLFELTLKLLRTKIVDKGCKAIDEELSGIFFGKVLDIRMDARPKTIGTFASQIKNFEMVRNFMTSSTLFLLADAPFALFFILIIYFIGGPIAFVPLLLLPLCLALGFFAKWKISSLAEDQMNESGKKNGMLVETIDGIETIKSIGAEWKVLSGWKKITSSTSDKEFEIRNISSFTTSMAQTIQQLSYMGLIIMGVYEIHTGNMTQGALMACSIISNRALAPIMSIAPLMVQWEHSKAALKGLDSIMNLPSDKDNIDKVIIPDSCTGNIKLESVTFKYLKDLDVLKPTSLAIKPGERIAIIGPVGSGKSTLIKTISGLYHSSSGKVFLDDVDITHIAPEFLREHIGYLSQDVRLFSGTLRENLILGLPSPSDEQILKVSKLTGLDKIIRGHPQGLNLEILEGGKGLSGGQRQVVGLTRLMLSKPDILILDEPTASLDGDLEMNIMKNLFALLNQKTTIILTTHKIGLLSLVDRVIVLEQGRVLIDGPRDAVMAKLKTAREAPKSSLAKNTES